MDNATLIGRCVFLVLTIVLLLANILGSIG